LGGGGNLIEVVNLISAFGGGRNLTILEEAIVTWSTKKAYSLLARSLLRSEKQSPEKQYTKRDENENRRNFGRNLGNWF
jgi:hypothetical protein